MAVENYVGFIRPLRDFGEEYQRKLIADYVKRHGGKVVAEYVQGTLGGEERNEWLRRTRPSEGAIVADLSVIAEGRAKGNGSPTADFAAVIAGLMSSVAIVVDARAGITSKDGAKWRDLVQSAASRVAGGRQLSARRASEMAKAKNRAHPGVKAHWHSPKMKHALKRWQQHWRDPEFSSARAAFEAMDADVQEEIGSLSTANKIFGPRKPGDPSAGGRGKKRKRKR